MKARLVPPGARATLLATLIALTGCAAPPARPDHAAPRDQVPLAGLPAPARAGWPDAQWWRAYADPQLDTLVERAARQAPDIALAQSRVQGAEQSARLAAAQAGLSINGSAQVARQRLSEHGLIPSRFLGFSWYNQADLGIQLQYDFDWWGKRRATVQAALDQAHAAEAERSAATLALQYAVAETYFGWQADQARLRLAGQAVQVQQQLQRIAALRVHQGVDLPDELQTADARLAIAREQRAALEGSARIRLAALAALLGVAPQELPPLQPRPLPGIDSGLPPRAGLDLIARRPDIAASRWQIEAAIKQTDVARAEFFPDLSISALAGLSSIDLGKLFTAGSRTFGLTPALHLPIFNGGALTANYGLQRAQLDAAVAQYNATVLDAAREVASAVLTAQMVAARRTEQQVALHADTQLLGSAQARERQGVRDARERLAAQAQLLQQRDAAAQLQAQAVSADLALIKALGGGYRASLPAAPVAARSTLSSSSAVPAGADHEQH